MGGEGWESEDPIEGWKKRTSDPYDAWRLAGMLAFAKNKGKPFQVDEWGVFGPKAGPFVTAMAEFLRTNGVRSHTYWDHDSGFPGELHMRGEKWPETTTAFKKEFGPVK